MAGLVNNSNVAIGLLGNITNDTWGTWGSDSTVLGKNQTYTLNLNNPLTYNSIQTIVMYINDNNGRSTHNYTDLI